MTKPHQQFLELLRSGLWGTPADPSLFQGDVNWRSILRIGKEQAVHILIADGIESLPNELWPDLDTMLKIMTLRVKTKNLHLQLNSILSRITKALNQEQIPSVLLKGYGLASNYRLPQSRMCGDIDIYVGQENFDKAYNTIVALSTTTQADQTILPDDHMHKHVEIDKVTIEVHRKASSSANLRQRRLFDNWTIDSIDNHFADGTLPTVQVEDTVVRIPDATFNAVFVLHHAVRHMITEGIGLRQICDWTMFLDKHHHEINQTELRKVLKKFHMESIWAEFGILAINILGLDPSHLPLAPANLTSQKTNKILKQIFITGNFGHYDKKGRYPKETNVIKRKWRSLLVQTRHFRRTVRIFPQFTLSYIVGWYPSAICRLFHR